MEQALSKKMDIGSVSYFSFRDSPVYFGASIQCNRAISVRFHYFHSDAVHSPDFPEKTGEKRNGHQEKQTSLEPVHGISSGCGNVCSILPAFQPFVRIQHINPFVYIGSKTFNGDGNLVYFLIYLAIVMTFSPIGEELFYRGVVHEAFRERLGERNASLIDSAAFALTHMAHFGIIFTLGSWKFLPLPSLIWISSMFFTCLVFNWTKRKSGSILGAILTHAGFNAGMGLIFYYL